MRKSDLLDEDYIKEKTKLLHTAVDELPEEQYTLIATAKIRQVQEDAELQRAIQEGNTHKFEEFLEDLLDRHHTWGGHLRRYLFDTVYHGEGEISNISTELLKSKIYNAFSYNGMMDRGSIHPDKETSLQARLESWLEMPPSRLDRDTCFLFAFGLNMDEEWTSYFLTDVLRKADFNPRNPEEAIYYYCLYNNLKYHGVKKWLKAYEEVAPKARIQNLYTQVMAYDLQVLTEDFDDDKFLSYLAELKYLQQKNGNKKQKFSDTKAKVFNYLLVEMYCNLSEEKEERYQKGLARYEVARQEVETNSQAARYKREEARRAEKAIHKKMSQKEREDLEWILTQLAPSTFQVSEHVKTLFDKKILWMPSFSPGSIRKQIEDKTTEVKREDILLATYLLCANDKGNHMRGKSYGERMTYFTYMADYWLERAGFGEFYFLAPFELFLSICLLQEDPLEYILGVWKKYRVVKEKKEGAK